MTARIAAATFAPAFGDLRSNAAMTVALVRRARAQHADVIVLPELCLSGYAFESAAEVDAAAITTDHPVFASWSDALGGRDGLVVGGFAERMPDGTFCISAAVVDSHGVRAVYRKTHLWHHEKHYFIAGDTPPPIIETGWGRIGVLICYDLEFPEMPRTLAMRGADLIVLPTNWSHELSGGVGEPAQVMVARATARLNHVYVACADRTGIERGQRFAGGSTLIDTRGRVLALPHDDGIAIAEMDLERARDRDVSPLNHVFGDRRPELYA